MKRTSVIATLCCALLCAGCTRGKSKQPAGAAPAAGPQAAESNAAPANPAPAADDDWNVGRLPKSVLEGMPRNGGEITVRINAEPPSLNSIVDSDWLADRIAGLHVYETLTKVDPYDNPRYQHLPALAESWEVSPDNLSYTFHLRKGVKFHDGTPFTARDVIATFDKVMDETTKAAHVRSFLEELKRYEATDDFTVRFLMKRPYFLAMDSIAAGVPIQPAHVIAKLTGTQYNEAATNPLNRAPIGTGPFKFKEWQSKQRIVLERNAAYWARPPYLDRVTFRIVEDNTVALELTDRGEVDVMHRMQEDQWVNASSPTLRRNFNRSRFFEASYQWIGWNAAKPFFADKRVRRALTMLIDRQGVIDKLMHGIPRVTTCHFYWAGADCDPNVKPLPFDPKAADKLLSEAGWTDSNGDGVRDKGGVAFRFNFMIPAASEVAAKIGTLAKEEFSRAGIDMQIQKVEWSAFLKRLREHSFDACTLMWGGGARDDPTQIWHSKSQKGGSNYIGYHNPEADKLMEDARVTLDDAARHAMYQKLHRILYDEQPYTWMFLHAELSLVHKRIKGARETLQWWQFEDLWVDPSAK
jgi:peptide/nickel transport system substrate-binding protein